MSALTQDQYYSLQQDLLKMADSLASRQNNLATTVTLATSCVYGGTGETAASLWTAIQAIMTTWGT
jgi:hypothetical protein